MEDRRGAATESAGRGIIESPPLRRPMDEQIADLRTVVIGMLEHAAEIEGEKV